jgi:hypothetical protein
MRVCYRDVSSKVFEIENVPRVGLIAMQDTEFKKHRFKLRMTERQQSREWTIAGIASRESPRHTFDGGV